MTETGTAPIRTEPYAISWSSIERVLFFGSNRRFHAKSVGTEAEAEEEAARISAEHGHASVHTDGNLLFSYGHGELLTDNR
jgi:hypothetical protein